MTKEDEVPVTGPMLSLIKALHSARTLFIHESAMAEELGMEKPQDWGTRCNDLFFKTYAKQIEAMGLRLNRQTYDALMRVQVPEDAWSTVFDELPRLYSFDPWAGQGYGGINKKAEKRGAAPGR